jgi:hypothetical protein
MGKEDGGGGLEMTLNWNELFKDTVALVKGSKATGANKSIQVDYFPKAAGKIKEKAKSQHFRITKQLEEKNLPAAALDYVYRSFDLPLAGSVGYWILTVEWDGYRTLKSNRGYIANLDTSVRIAHQAPGTELNISAQIVGKSADNDVDGPRMAIRFDCEFDGLIRTTYDPRCQITPNGGSFQ